MKTSINILHVVFPNERDVATATGPPTPQHLSLKNPSCFIHEIDKSIAQIRMAVKITRQIQKVEVAREPLLLQQLQEHMPPTNQQPGHLRKLG